jgi:hypothetical protein
MKNVPPPAESPTDICYVWRSQPREGDSDLTRALRAAARTRAGLCFLECRDEGVPDVRHGPFRIVETARTRLDKELIRVTNKYAQKELLLDPNAGTCRVLLRRTEHYRFDLQNFTLLQ